MTMIETMTVPKVMPLVVRFRPLYDMTPDEFYRFCQLNPDLRVELTSEGEVVFMSPSGGMSSAYNALVIGALFQWALRNGEGVAFDSSGGFILPNGAVRSPDSAWINRDRLSELTPEQQVRFLPLCPDFVVEVASPSDRLSDLRAKMDEYVANGAQLGWLIVPDTRSVYVYRPDEDVEHLSDAESVSGDPVLPGFVLELGPIWKPAF